MKKQKQRNVQLFDRKATNSGFKCSISGCASICSCCFRNETRNLSMITHCTTLTTKALNGEKTHHKANEHHLPYGITWCYLLRDTGQWAPPKPQPKRLVLNLPIPDGWKAELTLTVGYSRTWFVNLPRHWNVWIVKNQLRGWTFRRLETDQNCNVNSMYIAYSWPPVHNLTVC